MFNTAVLNLAIGLIFCFLTVSLATGAIVEAIASFLKVRAKTLRKGIGQLLNDPNFTGLAKTLYDHAAVNPRGSGTGTTSGAYQRTDPAYIDRQLFGQAMLDILKISPEIAANPAASPTVADLKAAVASVLQLRVDPQIKDALHGVIDRWFGNPAAPPTPKGLKDAVDRVRLLRVDPQIKNELHEIIDRSFGNPAAPPTAAELKAAIDGVLQHSPDPQIQNLLHGIIERSVGDPNKIKAELVAWFDNAMDRVGGWYKRWTQLIAFLAALILAAGLNIDSIGVARTLWVQPTFADKLMADNKLNAGQAISELSTAIPIGWPNGILLVKKNPTDTATEWFWNVESGWSIVYLLAGWLITALSTLFGAPFWFDLLQTVIRLKGSGPSPVEKVDGKGASA